jgi:hypothetical protein
LHDLIKMDASGIPGVTVVSKGFVDAMDMQSEALGFDPAVIYVPHPIQNLTHQELMDIADAIIEPAIAKLTSG